MDKDFLLKLHGFTPPTVCDRGGDMGRKWYVEYFWYADGKENRERVYTGRKYGMLGSGNALTDIRGRRDYFAVLAEVLKKKLADGWRPNKVRDPVTLRERVDWYLDRISVSDDVEYNKRRYLYLFAARIGVKKPHQVTTNKIVDFLSAEEVAAATYNDHRKHLHSFFEHLVRSGIIADNPVTKVDRRRERATKNEAYTEDELRVLLPALEAYNEKLYLCALLMLYAFVRPHKEGLQMTRSEIDFDGGTVSVLPEHRKGGDVFVLPLHPQLRDGLVRHGVDALPMGARIFDVNRDYFRTAWTRFKKSERGKELVRERQTLYSIRHSAACMFFAKTKDPELLRRAMGHSKLTTTLTYLRSLGLFLDPVKVEQLPTL